MSTPPYTPAPGFFDELFDAPDRPRPGAEQLAAALGRLGRDRLQAAGARRDAIFVQQGITFDAAGPDGPTRDRPFPLDLVPRILGGDEWRVIKRGLAQRVRGLNLFVEDVTTTARSSARGSCPGSLSSRAPRSPEPPTGSGRPAGSGATCPGRLQGRRGHGRARGERQDDALHKVK